MLHDASRFASEFDLKSLYDALDQRRRSRKMTWADVAREVNRFGTGRHQLASSTIRSLETQAVAEGDGALQMLLWLGRTPESFVSTIENPDAGQYKLADLGPQWVLRWDAKALYSAQNAQRKARKMTWVMVAQQAGGFNSGKLTRLAKGGRVGLPGVTRIVR